MTSVDYRFDGISGNSEQGGPDVCTAPESFKHRKENSANLDMATTDGKHLAIMSSTHARFLGRMAIVLVASWNLLCWRSVAGSPEILGADFRFHGKPIHPLLIKQFEPWVSDSRPPITIEVNLTAAWDSNQYAAEFKTDSNGVVSINLPEGASYAYRHLGKLRYGTHVLRTSDSGGGSGVFEAVLFVRFRTSVAYLADGVKQAPQVFLQVVRRYPLGDRDGAKVEVQPDRVIVGKSRYREEPVVLKFEKDEARPGRQKAN